MVAAEGDHGELGGLEFRPQAKEDDNEAERELRLQLKEAGRRLLNPTDSVEELLHVLDQLWKLLLKVDQSPNNVMKEALSPPMKALVAGSLLEHSSMDVKVSVASCLCEITRITAPQAPYSDEELKGVFQCIVSSLENLSDKSSRFYHKRVAILDSVSKVRSCVIMLDLECDDLIVKLFEHFLNSVRDHHVGDIFSLMVNIMALVLEESEDISLDLLKPLLASVKNNSEGVLPVARKLGEAVFKKSADKIRPCLNKAMTDLGKSLVDYSQLLTSISEGTTDFLEHNDGSATNQPKVVDTAAENVSFEDAAPVASDADTVTGNEENVDAQQSKKPEGAADRSGSNLNIKLDTRNPAVEKSKNVESKLDTTTKSTEFETVNSENIAEKSPEIVVSVQKPLESEVADAPSQSGSQQEESQNKIQIKKGIRSKKKGPSPTVPLPTVVALTKVNEVTSDSEMRSPKRVRKKTEKAEENTPTVTTGSDVEPSKNSGKKVKTGDSGPKPAKSSGKKVDGGGSVAKKRKLSGKKAPELKKSKQDGNEDVEAGNSAAKKPKLDGKKAPESEKPKQDDTIEVEAGDSVAKKPKLAGKKAPESKKSKQDNNKEVEAGDSAAKKPKLSGKKVPESKNPKQDDNKEVEAGDSVAKKPKLSGKKVPESKNSKQDDNKEVEAGDSVAKKPKLSGKKVRESKKQKQDDNKEMDSGDSQVKPAKRSLKKDNETVSTAKPLKASGKKGQKRKVITKPSEENANKDEETDSDNTPLKLSENKSENKEKETNSDPKPLNLSDDKDDEETETDSDNIPLKLSAKRGNKSSSSVVKSSSKNKDGNKQGGGKNIEEKNQTKSLSEDDDGMDVSLKSVLKKATKGKGNLEGARSTGSKRKRSVTKKKVTETIKYDDSLVGQKVKVWWPEDKMYYEGVVVSFSSAEKKHKVSYVDGDEETLNLMKEKWEILKEFSTPIKEVADVQNSDILPDIVGSTEGENKVNTKEVESKEDKKTKKDDKKATPKKIVYSRGKKESKSKTKSPGDNVKESGSGNAAEEPESEKEKSTETPKTGAKTGKKKRKMN